MSSYESHPLSLHGSQVFRRDNGDVVGEFEKCAQFLRRYNCARAQGFIFSAALPPEQIPEFVREREREAAAIPLLPDLALPSAGRVFRAA